VSFPKWFNLVADSNNLKAIEAKLTEGNRHLNRVVKRAISFTVDMCGAFMSLI
jgi:hypothetical protein